MASAAIVARALTLAVVFGVRTGTTPVTSYVCVNMATGSIQLTTATGTCKQGYTLISWNQVGPQVPHGAHPLVPP